MDVSTYTAAPVHRAEHGRFLRAVSLLVVRLDRQGPSAELAQAVLALQPEIESHISTLARFLIAHPPVPPDPMPAAPAAGAMR